MRWNAVVALLLSAIVFLQYRLWFEADGIRDMLQIKKQLAMQTDENSKLKKRNEELVFQVRRLQSSQDATESRARNELGMIKKGEVFYQIIKQGQGT